ncbi:Bax inhibitor-1/YccA family protein [Klenkia sp. PcliD-1-E]|uniref:Bax inhibitor-1/YccA family membrane protein n=1 Tax=Klenkia sp. PcliD-1-E TaxID=2954492 RepID=UPI002097F236|nr:Bax inhibitor-1/YccA family protein [Klenkia sp. PcliD-1-E]MCO7221038.1 Bax inhibitor-1/YccA family protein [Klenkia sp. PcliD-1-E]
MPSSNPAFSRGFPGAPNGPGAQSGNQGYAQPGPQQYGAPQPWGQQAPQQSPYQQNPYAATGQQYMTMDDVVSKTGISFLVTVLAAAAIWAVPGQAAMGLALPAVLVAFVVGLVISFKQIANPVATLAYAALMGVGVGAISEAFNAYYPGIVTQAVIGTFGVFFGMLVVYKTGAIRVTPKLTRWIVGAMFGVLALMLVNLVAALIGGGDGLGLRSGGPVAIVFSLVVIGVAAFSLLLDFDMADEAIRRGVQPKVAWYIAFGLLVTVIWLYLEILRLLSYFRE